MDLTFKTKANDMIPVAKLSYHKNYNSAKLVI